MYEQFYIKWCKHNSQASWQEHSHRLPDKAAYDDFDFFFSVWSAFSKLQEQMFVIISRFSSFFFPPLQSVMSPWEEGFPGFAAK